MLKPYGSSLKVGLPDNFLSIGSDNFHPGFKDESALLKHELAYCLGQMKDISSLPVLEKVLRSKSEDPMVRHEVIHSSTPQSTSACSYRL